MIKENQYGSLELGRRFYPIGNSFEDLIESITSVTNETLNKMKSDSEKISEELIKSSEKLESSVESIYERKYNIHEIFTILKSLPKYSLASVNIGFDTYYVMLDEDNNLICVENDENEEYYEINFKMRISTETDYYHEHCSDESFLNSVFTLVKPKEENWVKCNSGIREATGYCRLNKIKIKSVISNEEKIYDWKEINSVDEFIEMVSKEELYMNDWYYLEVE